MTTTDLAHGAPAGLADKLRRLAEAGLRGLAALWRAAENRRTVARLLDWDAHMLRDIGLTPGDVRAALSAPLGHDPSSHLHVLSLERRMAVRANAEERHARQGYFLRTMLSRAPLPPVSDGRSGRYSA